MNGPINVIKIVKMVLYIVAVIVLAFIISSKFSKRKIVISSSSTLREIIPISEIQTATVPWEGVASFKVGLREVKVRYEADITAKYNVEKFFEENINIEGNKIKIKIPEVEYIVAITQDTNEMSFIPEDTKWEPKVVIETCKSDAENEIKTKSKINEIANENFKQIISGFLYFATEDGSYEIEWE